MDATLLGGPFQRMTLTKAKVGSGPSSTTPVKDTAPVKILSKSSLWQTLLYPTRHRCLGVALRLSMSTSYKCISGKSTISGFKCNLSLTLFLVHIQTC